MNYIVLDLEWNQPINKYTGGYRKTGKQLSCELIQVGAVKLDESRRMIGSFNSFIAPSFYKKINPRINRITGISQDDADSSKPFPDVYKRFISWCGEDFVFVTWGCDDIPVFVKNISVFPLEKSLPDSYDAQQLFTHITGGGKNRLALRRAMAHYNISSSPDHPFHSAVDDAYYTALVIQKFPEVESLLNYKTKISWPSDDEGSDGEIVSNPYSEKKVRSISASLKTPFALSPPCPACAKVLTIPEGYIADSTKRKYQALADCKTHGLVRVDMAFEKADNSGYIAKRTCEIAEEQHPAYVKTKHFQWAKNLAQQKSKESKNANKNKQIRKKNRENI